MPAADALAINGGTPVITEPFLPYRSLGEEEIAAANRVLRSGVLSAFIGAPDQDFMAALKFRRLSARRRNVLASSTWFRLTPGPLVW